MSSSHDNLSPSSKKEVKEALLRFGLSCVEIEVYLACLKLGARSASVVAREAGLKRGHTYNVLDLLGKKALVQEFLKNNIRQFVAQPPRTLLSLVESRKREIMGQCESIGSILPYLESFITVQSPSAKVRFFRGEEGIKTVYEDTISFEGGIIYAIADFAMTFPSSKNDKLHKWMWNYASRRAKQGIWYHGIVNKSPLSDLAFKRRQAEKRRMKILRDVFLPVEVNIYQNKVAITSSANDLSGIIVEDENIAETLRNFHISIWEFLPNYR